jgi:hypothetical protein
VTKDEDGKREKEGSKRENKKDKHHYPYLPPY